MTSTPEQSLLTRWRDRALDRRGLLGGPGYWLPDPAAMQWHVLRGRIGGVVAEADNDGNRLLLHPDHGMTRPLQVRIAPGVMGCVLAIGPGCSFHGELEFHARDATVILSGGKPSNGHWGWIKPVVWSQGGTFYLGRGTSSNGTQFLIDGPAASVLLGDDCMLASRTAIRSADQHAVVQLDDGAWCNPPGDVILEPHVWLGEGAMVGKDLVIGLGSIVGAQALVLRGCERFSLLGGVPARSLRRGVSWDRTPRPGPDLRERMRALDAAVPPI